MFSSNSASWVSPKSTYIAYASFDDTEVPTIILQSYKDQPYPELSWINYPKAGYSNPVVSLIVYNLKNDVNITVNSSIKE